jgi:gas vesicle protein
MRDQDELPYIVVERRSGGAGWFLWGALIGAGVALLYAPRAGAQTRQDIREGAQRMRRKAEDSVRQVQSTVVGTFDDLRNQVTARVDAARDAVDAGREAARETRQDMERRVRESRAAWRAGTTAPRTGKSTPTTIIEEDVTVTRIEVDATEQPGM